ncbi:MAG: DEAD/DEAH box helicase [Chloroflexi bacterium]|nr:DEAD/DEAH box helicase [Chloroflexota bacterium]
MAFVLRRKPDFSAKHSAYPFQLDAIRAVKDRPYAGIFHEQGLGKTKIAIDLALLWLESDDVDTVFVVTKKALVENWRNEIAAHSHITPHVLTGNRAQNSASFNSPVLLYVTNYEVLAANAATIRLFLKTCRVGCILDESQKIKNPKAALTRFFHELAPSFERRIIMTGTPAANRPYDIWAQIKFLDNGAALGDSFDEFKEAMDLPASHSKEHDLAKAHADTHLSRSGHAGSTATDYGDRLAGIFDRLRSFTIRETKDTAGIQLPEKTVVARHVDLPEWQMLKYTAYRDELAYEYNIDGSLQIDDADSILKRMLRLVQCASNPGLIDGCFDRDPGKLPILLDMCREFTCDSKLIIWTGFVENVNWLAARLSEFDPVCIHGNLPIHQRNDAVTRFTKSSNPVLIATPGAAKEGLTLTVANHAIFFDRGFSLDDYLQAQDRIHRISQTRKCYIHNLMANDTIDSWVDVLLTAKFHAAQLAQGDIEVDAFREAFHTDVAEALQAVLFPDRIAYHH